MQPTHSRNTPFFVPGLSAAAAGSSFTRGQAAAASTTRNHPFNFPQSVAAASTHPFASSQLTPARASVLLSNRIRSRDFSSEVTESVSSKCARSQQSPFNDTTSSQLANDVKQTIQRQKELSKEMKIDAIIKLFSGLCSNAELLNLFKLLKNNPEEANSKDLDEEMSGSSASASQRMQTNDSHSTDLTKDLPIKEQLKAEMEEIVDKLETLELWTNYIKTLRTFPQSQWKNVGVSLLNLFNFKKTPQTDGSAIVLIWNKISLEDKYSLVKLLQNPLIHELETVQNRAYFIEIICLLPPSERQDLSSQLIVFLKPINDLKAGHQLLDSIRLLKDRTPLFFKRVFPFLLNLVSVNFRLQLCHDLMEIYPQHQQNLEVILAGLALTILTKRNPGGELFTFFTTVRGLPPGTDARKAFKDFSSKKLEQTVKALPHLIDLKTDWQRRLMLNIMDLIPVISSEILKQIYDFLLKYSTEQGSLLDGNGSWDLPKQILTHLTMLAPDQRMGAIEKWGVLKDCGEICPGNVLAILFNYDPAFKNASESHLKQIFTTVTERRKAYDLAEQIKELVQDLEGSNRTKSDDDLLVEAEKVLTLANSRANEAQNPYVVYERLIKKTSLVEVTPPLNLGKKANHDFVLNLKGFQTRQKKNYTFKDLPDGINLETYRNMFAAINNRLNSLSHEKRLTTFQQMAKQCPMSSINDLEKRILGTGKALLSLFAIKGGHEDPLPSPLIFYLYASINYISQCSDVIHEGQLLSPKEIQFLKLASWVSECNSGQDDGVTLFYSGIPSAFKISKEENFEQEAIKKIHACIENAMQSQLLNLFANEVALEQLAQPASVSQQRQNEEMKEEECKEDPAIIMPQIKQYTHYTTYLQNNFYREVGLSHQLKFDMGTETLPSDFVNAINKQPDKSLKTLLSFLTLDRLLKTVKNAMTEALQINHIQYGGLCTFFEENLACMPLKPSTTIKDFLILRQNITKGVTTLGALIILKAMGYIQLQSEIESESEEETEDEDISIQIGDNE